MKISIKCDCGNEDKLTTESEGDTLYLSHTAATKPIYIFTEGQNIKIKCLACDKEQEI